MLCYVVGINILQHVIHVNHKKLSHPGK